MTYFNKYWTIREIKPYYNELNVINRELQLDQHAVVLYRAQNAVVLYNSDNIFENFIEKCTTKVVSYEIFQRKVNLNESKQTMKSDEVDKVESGSIEQSEKSDENQISDDDDISVEYGSTVLQESDIHHNRNFEKATKTDINDTTNLNEASENNELIEKKSDENLTTTRVTKKHNETKSGLRVHFKEKPEYITTKSFICHQDTHISPFRRFISSIAEWSMKKILRLFPIKDKKVNFNKS